MRKLPTGVSNYEKLIEQGYKYIDKTEYIEKLEELPNSTLMFLRPRKFGKTLFTSVLENYYDKLKTDKFEKLFGKTYIGKNPTKNKNKYYILKFNFSGIDTETEETTMNGFKREVSSSVNVFVKKYGLDFYINTEDEAENILDNLFKAFLIQKKEEKIYVIIDEYDHFANELLGFHTENFKNLVSKNGKVRKWYEILKKGTESVVDRIFITGVAPITLDSLTSGFNISKDITRDERFNEMIGFTEEEVKTLMKDQELGEEEQEKLLPIMKQNYDGYRFSLYSKNNMYNSNMCLYLLSEYVGLGRIPESLVDVNIASDYAKLGKMLDLCTGEKSQQILEEIISGKGVISEITEKFNPEIGFEEKELISMLYYLGYLTIKENIAGYPRLVIPNKIMQELYSDYFLKIVSRNINLNIDSNYSTLALEIALEGKIGKTIEMLGKYLNNLSNRDYMKFDEKYIKLIFYCIAMNIKIYNTKSEMEVQRKYPDILMIPKDTSQNFYSIMIEFKYLKKGEENRLEEKQKEAKEQIEEYSNLEEIKTLKNLKKYTVIAVVDKIYVEEI